MTAKHYKNNRFKLIKQLSMADAILIVGNANVIRNADTAYPFRQDSNVLYLSGLDTPSISIFIDVKSNKSFIVLPSQSKTEIIFEGLNDTQLLMDTSGCDGTITYRELYDNLTQYKEIFTNIPAPITIGASINNGFKTRINTHLVKRKIVKIDARPALAILRMVKQDYEVQLIKKAVGITKQALNNIEPFIWRKDQTEHYLSWAVTAEFAKHNTGHAYPPIVASGNNAAILHSLPTNKLVEESVLFDVGAEYYGYSADISRTYYKKNNNLYTDLCLVQAEIIKYIKPGILFKEIHELAVKMLAELALKHRIEAPIGTLFPHSIGHHLGLDTHDLADYTAPLAKNMIITIEPGLYSKETGIGMRIEDDILITAHGATVL